MPRRRQRRTNRRRPNRQRLERNQDALNLVQPSVKAPDFLQIQHTALIGLVETTNNAMWAYFRPCSYGINTLTFALYADNMYQNIIRPLSDYYNNVAIKRFSLYYQPPHQLSGSLIGTLPTQVVCTQETSLSVSSDFSNYGSVTLHQIDKPWSISYSPMQKAKEMGYPVRIFPANKLNSVSTANYDAPWTIGIHFPDYIGNQPGAYSMPKGSVRVVVSYEFRGLAAF